VGWDTPARRATSVIVMRLGRPSGCFAMVPL
jgi:hypothetical protein